MSVESVLAQADSDIRNVSLLEALEYLEQLLSEVDARLEAIKSDIRRLP